jgi:hypothetical protein
MEGATAVRIFTRKRAAAAVTAIVVAGGAMAAYAYWTGGGSGSGSATATTPSALTVNQSTSVTGLFPGATATTLSGDFDNPNSGSVFVHNVTGAVHAFSTQADGTKPACTQADFAIAGTANVDAQVPAGTGVGSWTGLTVRLLNGSGNQDNCKGVSITIDYTANGS